MESESFSRRQFLQNLARQLTTASGLELAYALSGTPTSAASSCKVSPWKGDDFSVGHKLRNHDLPIMPEKSERTVDFVIVGGGMAGLTAAYYLRDHNFLLLEQYDALGGQSRGDNYHGIGYSYGAAYINSVEGLVGELISDLKLSPAKLEPIKNAWRWENSWLSGVEGKQKVFSEFKSLLTNCKPIWKELMSGIPVPLTSDSLLKLDAQPFAEFLKAQSPAFTALIDSYLKASLCGGVDMVSTLAGIATLEDLVQPSYVFPGGNPALAQALANKIRGERTRNGFVWSVDLSAESGGAAVTYSDAQGGMHRVSCRHVIVTTPPLVAARILHHVDDSIKANLLSFKYGSYLVANILLRKQVFKGAYDNFVTPPYSFSDITVAETPYIAKNLYRQSMGSVLTVYQPYVPSSEGRSILLKGDREALSKSVVAQLIKLIGPIEKDIETVVLSRWGHAMAVCKPGFYARISKFNRAESALTLAHCSTQGIPCAESAIAAARVAANRALGKRERS